MNRDTNTELSNNKFGNIGLAYQRFTTLALKEMTEKK